MHSPLSLILVPFRASSFVDRSNLHNQIKDYSKIGVALFYQRQAIFLAATILTGFYFNPYISVACYVLVLTSEAFDILVFRRALSHEIKDYEAARRILNLVLTGTAYSASCICLFVLAIALQQEEGRNFTPLFFLFAAGIFAAMNNHQILPALILRLLIYSFTFLYIPLRDIWINKADITSLYWLQFFTVVFVLYFIIDCSRIFLQMYRKSLEQFESLRQEHQKTQRALAAKSQFLSTVSHELRTPLTPIKATLDLAATDALGDVPPKLRNALEIARKNSQGLAELIDSILDFQSIEAGELHLELEAIRLSDAISDAVERTAQDAAFAHVTGETNGLDRDFMVGADRPRLSQALSNVLSNAIKHSSEASTVSVNLLANEELAQITIEDRGDGIPEGNEDVVFGVFSQLDSSDTRKTSGTGMGLSISKMIVERHGGKIGYESRLGHGTTFTIELPIADRDVAQPNCPGKIG